MDEQLWAEYLKTRSDAARNAILEHHWPWISRRTEAMLLRRKHFHPSGPVLSHIAHWLLAKHIPRFDPTRSSFRRHLSPLLYRLVSDYLRTGDGRRRSQRDHLAQIEEARVRLSHQFGRRATDAEVAQELHTTERRVFLATTEQFVQLAFAPGIFSRNQFESLIEGMKPRHKGLLRLYYLHRYTAEEIAARAGVSPQAICKRLERAIELLRGQVVFSRTWSRE